MRKHFFGGNWYNRFVRVVTFFVLVSIIGSPCTASAQAAPEIESPPLESEESPEILTLSEPPPSEEPDPAQEAPLSEEEVPTEQLPPADEGLLESPQLLSLSPGADVSPDLTRKTIQPRFYSEPDPVTGSLSFSYPIAIPPGRSGLQPDVTLRYTSQPGEDVNALGYGWDVGIPYIERINKKGTDTTFDQSYFYSSLDGELYAISTSTGSYGAKVDTEAFNRYEYASSTHWIVTDKFGTQYTFGLASTTRQDNPSNDTQIHRWMLEEVRDTNDNFVSYSYFKNEGSIYSSTITYTGHDVTPGIFEITFLNEARPDIATSTASGFEVVSKRRISDIEVRVDGRLVRTYELTYGTGDNGYRSLLSSITESGITETGATSTLPATAFTYKESSKNWTQSSSLEPPVPLNAAAFLGDLNGDSLVDILYSSESEATSTAYINTTSTWTASSTWTPPIYFWNDTQALGARLSDVNGDGLTDIVHSYTNGSTTANTYLNNGAGWTASSTWNMPVALSASGENDLGVRLMDINGDGLTDIAKSATTSAIYINNGAGWTASSTWSIPLAFTQGGEDNYVRTEDVNGDGLVDLLQSYATTTDTQNRVYINSGQGWDLDPQWTLPTFFARDLDVPGVGTTTVEDYGVRLADVNGDGFTDVIQAYSSLNNSTSTTYINNGHGWTADPLWHAPDSFVADDSYDPGWRFADANGDGLLDLLFGHPDDPKTYLNNSRPVDVLETVTYPQGGVASFTYKAASEYLSGGNLRSPRLPLSVNTLASMTLDDGRGTEGTTAYTYGGGAYFYANAFDRQFAGFEKIIKEDAEGNQTIDYYHQGNSSDSAHGEYQDASSKIGRKYRSESYEDDDDLLAKHIYRWDTSSLSGNRAFVHLTQQVDSAYEGNATHRDVGTTIAYNNATGNVSSKKTWGEVTGSDDGTFSDTGSDAYTTSYTYASSTVGYITGLVANATTTDQSSTRIKEQRFYYDSGSLHDVTLGNLTKQEDWITSSTYASSTSAYNSYGLPTSTRDPLGYQTTYDYDTHNLYVATTTNPLTHTLYAAYDYASGAIATTTDANGAVRVNVFDGLGRLIAQKGPDVTASSTPLALFVTYEYDDSVLPSVHVVKWLSAATSTDAYYYLDGFSRIFQLRTEGEKSNDFATQDFKYNERGLLRAESLPYFSNGSNKTTATNKDDLYLDYTYDPLGRVAEVESSVGSTETTYGDWVVTLEDSNGNEKATIFDAYGRIASVLEQIGTTTATTTYAYDGNNNLVTITDSQGNLRNFTYDGLSRQLTAEDLHASGDATFGSWSYGYDLSGNRTSSVNPNAQTVNYTYDALNRTLTENYTGQAGVEKTYVYDSCSNGKGFLCSAGTASATTTYAYNLVGNNAVESRLISGTTYVATTTYDRQGNPTTLRYPDGSVAFYLYNSAGQLDAVKFYDIASSSPGSIVSDIDYGPTGQIIYQQFANQTETFHTYDPYALYRRTDTKTIGPGEGISEIQAMRMMSMMEESSPYAEASLANPIEVPELGSDRVQTFYVGKNEDGDGMYAARVYERPLYNEVASIAESKTGWVADGPGYRLDLNASSDSELFSYAKNGTNLSVSIADKKAQASTGFLNGTAVEYQGVLGKGVDLEVTIGDSFVRKEIVLSANPLTSEESYEVTFKITATSTLGVMIGDEELEIGDSITSTEPSVIYDSSGPVAYLWPPVAKNSSSTGGDHQIALPIRYELTADGLYLTKIIPASWLAEATYPVRADFTLATYAGIGDGSINPSMYPGTWSAMHNDTIGSGASFTDISADIMSGAYHSGGGYMFLKRVFMPFDTSSLPDDAVIGTTTLNLYALSTQNDFNDGEDTINVYEGTQSDPTSLINSDYAECGNAATNPSSGSTNLDITSISSPDIISFPLNATGTAWVSKTGYTKLCLREGHDAHNVQPVWNGGLWKLSQVTVATSEATGTSTDPYLQVLYTIPNIAPATTTELMVEGQTNPVEIATSTPRFSGRYNDPNVSDTATHYRIQVATSTSFTSPVWDSTKTSFSTTTEQGLLTPDIKYSGTPLAFDSTKYYWRIKLWDTEGEESPWSLGTDHFTMANDGSLLQRYHYQYDPVGNITQISETASTTRLWDYTYDTLNRLSVASTTMGTTTPLMWTYNYDSLGNITSILDQNPLSANTNAVTLSTTTSDYAYHSGASAFNLSNTMTIEAWVKFPALPTNGDEYTIAGKWDFDTGKRAYRFSYVDVGGTKKFRFVSSSACSNFLEADAAHTLSANTWYHVAAVKNGTSITFYVNGSTVGSGTTDSTLCTNTAKFSIGSTLGNSPINLMNSTIDDLRLWNTVRTSPQLIAYASSELTGSESGLVAYYKVNNNFNDATSGANNLTSSGSPTFTIVTPFTTPPTTLSYRDYDYAGNTGSLYANPHAVTSIGSGAATSTYTYDTNGNLTDDGSSSYTWDYNSQLTAATTASSSLSYAYDHAGQRVRLVASTTSIYPFPFYTVVDGIPEKDVYAGGQLVASVSSTTAHYVHPDHLGSTNVGTGPDGIATEEILYDPFGKVLRDVVDGGAEQSRKFIGQEYDTESSLSYLNARYYEGSRGQFLSQDPVFLENPKAQTLTNPQSLNSYSYANNNPILNKDPQGRAAYISNSGWTLNTNDADTNTYYEQNDINMLNANAAYMQAISDNPLKFEVFRENVWPVSGQWDFKRGAAGHKKDYYFFNGELVDAETFGNLHYGYVGSAGKFKPGTLKGAAGVAQIVAGTSKLSYKNSNFDDPVDQRNIQRGIDSYNKSLKSASSYISAASKALKSGNISAASSALAKAKKALKR